MRLAEIVKQLNAKVSDVANQEKAKKMRKKLITIGIIMLCVGIIGIISCFILFATAGMGGFAHGGGFSPRIIVPFCLFPIFGITCGIGLWIFNLGLSILVGGVATKFVDETIGCRCPKCGNPMTDNEKFCTQCGAEGRRTCPKCGNWVEPKQHFCSQCGTKIDN